jgi:microcystin degradation protein MlrC
LAAGEAEGRYPIILADQADNPGGGTPSDSTEILRLFVKKDLQKAAVLVMVDAESAAMAKQAGVGATVQLQAGGKSHPLLGPPVPLTAEVLAISDGRFVYDGPMWTGREGFHGDAALVRHRGIYVIFISEMCQPIDLAFPRMLGLDCRQLRYLALKSTGHFRSGFGPIAGSIYNVDAQGLLTQDFKRLPFKNLGRKVYPIDTNAGVDWSSQRILPPMGG